MQQEERKIITEFGKDGRDYSVDVLRCVSCFMIVVVHAINMLYRGSYGLPEIPIGTPNWAVLVIIRSLVVATTTLFFMVSGIFFLSPHRNVRPDRIWKKNILKLTSAYIFWCCTYQLYNLWVFDQAVTVNEVIEGIWDRPTHLWYIPALVGLYVVAPFLREITKNASPKLYRYGIYILILSYALNTITFFPELPYSKGIVWLISQTPAEGIASYLGMFIYGFYLYTYRPGHKMRRNIYLFGILSVIISCGFCFFASLNLFDAWEYHFFSKLSITTFGKNTAIFVLITTAFQKVDFSERAKKVLRKISDSTLIIYLLHIMILKITGRAGFLYNTGMNPVIAVILQVIFTFLLCFAAAQVFHLVPWKKLSRRIFTKKGSQ